MVNTMHTTLGSVSVSLARNISRPPLVLVGPNMHWMDISTLSLLFHEDILQYTISVCNMYLRFY